MMKQNAKRSLLVGIICCVAFIIWTILIQIIDVKPEGLNGTDVGFAAFNCWFHNLTGVHMTLYRITDWLGLVPVFVCMLFGMIGLLQLVMRKSLFKADYDIMILGIYYIAVILAYLGFEMYPVNYRPILIEGVMEASYPSSTTLLVLSVMPTLIFQVKRRMKNLVVLNVISIVTIFFSVFMIIGRLISGVHWFTDIVGGVWLSTGLFYVYKSVVLAGDCLYSRFLMPSDCNDEAIG